MELESNYGYQLKPKRSNDELTSIYSEKKALGVREEGSMTLRDAFARVIECFRPSSQKPEGEHQQ